jgi:hypothetical protein
LGRKQAVAGADLPTASSIVRRTLRSFIGRVSSLPGIGGTNVQKDQDNVTTLYADHTAASLRDDDVAIRRLADGLGLGEDEVVAALTGVHGKTLVRNIFLGVSELYRSPTEEVDEEGATGVEEEFDSDLPHRPYNPDDIRA